MSEKWEQRDRMIIARKGVGIITIDAVTPKLAHQIVLAVNNHERLVAFAEGIANHGACRGFSVDMVRCTAEARCNQCLSCAARDLLPKKDREEIKA